MESTPKQITSQETGATLQLERALLPIDEYAVREGVSRGIVEECGKLGIVQIRKYKGKSFVVDVPLSPYRYPSETTEGATKRADEGPHFTKSPQHRVPNEPKTAKGHTKSDNESIKPGTISALVGKMVHNASQITGKPVNAVKDKNEQAEKIRAPAQIVHPVEYDTIAKPAQSSSFSIKAGKIFLLVGRVFRRASQIISKRIGTTGGGIAKIEEKPDSTQVIRRDGVQFGPLTGSAVYDKSLSGEPTARVRAERTWQVAALFSIVFLFASLAANIWFYMGRQIQRDKLGLAYANIQTVYSDFIKADRQVIALQNELAESRTESKRIENELESSRSELGTVQSELAESRTKSKRIENELENSRAELKTVQDELTKARQELQTVRQRNAQAVERLHKQILRLTAWLQEPANSTQAPSGSDISGE